MTKFCCAHTILSPPTPPEKNLVKHRLAKNSESSVGDGIGQICWPGIFLRGIFACRPAGLASEPPC